jgi:hypothetical protein
MSRAITFRFCESASLRFAAEQGLGDAASVEIKGATEIAGQDEIKGNLDGVLVQETQFDFPSDQLARLKAFPQVRFEKKGVMTFIEIVIPDPSANDDVEQPAVSDRILQPSVIEAEESVIPAKEDRVDAEYMTFEVPELVGFNLEPGLGDAIKALEAGNQDFSLQALDGEFDIPKSIPASEEDFKIEELWELLRKKKSEREKVRVKIKSK